MIVDGNLDLVYDLLSQDEVKNISSFLDELTISIKDLGFEGDNRVFVRKYLPNDHYFSIEPLEKRVQYDGFESLPSRIYVVSFQRHGHDSKFVDQVFVGNKKDSSGVFLNTAPFSYD